MPSSPSILVIWRTSRRVILPWRLRVARFQGTATHIIYIAIQIIYSHAMTAFRSPERAGFGIRFSLLARRWRRVLDVRLAEAGLTAASWVPLVHLDETGGGITQKDLALRVGVDSSSLVRIIDLLAREGLIERQRDEADGRARLIHLTVDGKRRVEEIREELGRGEEALLMDLSDAEIATMLECFARIDRRLSGVEQLDREGDKR